MKQCNICKRIRPRQFPCNDLICDCIDYGPIWEKDMQNLGRSLLGLFFVGFILFLTIGCTPDVHKFNVLNPHNKEECFKQGGTAYAQGWNFSTGAFDLCTFTK